MLGSAYRGKTETFQVILVLSNEISIRLLLTYNDFCFQNYEKKNVGPCVFI